MNVKTVQVDPQVLQDALNYINHVGSNWTMRGQPHPQQWLVDKLEAAIKAASIDWKHLANEPAVEPKLSLSGLLSVPPV